MKGHKIMNYKHITINERCCIANFLDLGWSIRKIAKHLNRNASTISREIRRNSVNGKYLAHIANEIYLNNRMNCGSKGKSSNCKLIEYIENGLNKTWSPEQIAGRLRLEYKDDKSMKIGFKTIYRWIYKNIIIKGDVKKLRRKGKSLKSKETRGKFNIGKSIKNRPKDVRKRESFGHWELDTVVSSRGKSKACLSTFVERKSRYLIAQVMDNRKSTTFNLLFFFRNFIGPSIIKLLSLLLFLSTAAITLLTVYSLLVNAPNSTSDPALSQIIAITCELLAKNCS